MNQPRMIVLKNWFRKILEGTKYLHSQNFVHGKLTCESIYINSNCGDIKIGDLGIRAIPSYNSSKHNIEIGFRVF
jgi:serine/threonine protein kinase